MKQNYQLLKSYLGTFRKVALLLLFAAGYTISSYGQAVTGSISGKIRDNKPAIIW